MVTWLFCRIFSQGAKLRLYICKAIIKAVININHLYVKWICNYRNEAVRIAISMDMVKKNLVETPSTMLKYNQDSVCIIQKVPVRSRSFTEGLFSRISIHLTAVGWSIISFLFGEDSTWQWLQAWLQYNPIFICSCSVGFLVSRLGFSPVKFK